MRGNARKIQAELEMQKKKETRDDDLREESRRLEIRRRGFMNLQDAYTRVRRWNLMITCWQKKISSINRVDERMLAHA
ncbi:hypothetical protein Tco_0847915 [Tanacetum coccineum]